MYKKLHHIQRFRNTRKGFNAEGIERLITPECVSPNKHIGNSYERCFEWLAKQELEIYPISLESRNVTMYVVGTKESAERFKDHIEVHMCKEHSGRISHPPTGLYERFGSTVEGAGRNFKETNVWMEVTGGICSEYIDSVAPPVLFTADRFMAIRMYLALSINKLNPDNLEANVFDKVYIHSSKLEQTVIATDDDNMISVRSYDKTTRLHKRDVWPVNMFPLHKLQEFGVF